MATLKRPQIVIIFIIFILVIIILLLRTNSSSFGYNSGGYIVNIGTIRMDVFCEPAVSQSSQNLTGQKLQTIKLYNDRNEDYYYFLYGSSNSHKISKYKNNPSTIILNGGGGPSGGDGDIGAYLYIFKSTKREIDYSNRSLLIYVDGFRDYAMNIDSNFLDSTRSVGLIPDGTVYTYGVSTTTYGDITLYKSLVRQWDNFYKNAMFKAYNIPRSGIIPKLANHLNKQGKRSVGNYKYGAGDNAPENSIAFTIDYLRIVNITPEQRKTTNYLYY